MLLYVQGWINERTGWNNAYINLILILATAALTLALVLLMVRPEGFRTVGLSIIGGAAFGVVAGFLGTLRELSDEKIRANQPQMSLETGGFQFWKVCRWRCRVMGVEFACVGLFLGLLAGLAGE